MDSEFGGNKALVDEGVDHRWFVQLCTGVGTSLCDGRLESTRRPVRLGLGGDETLGLVPAVTNFRQPV